MDPTNAYAKTDLKGWRRHITLEKPAITVVLDEVSCASGAEIEARFHSEVTQTAKNGYILLDGEKGKMAMMPVSEGNCTFRPGRHAIKQRRAKMYHSLSILIRQIHPGIN